MAEYRARHHAQPAEAMAARRAVTTFAATCGFERADLQAIETAVGEAIANAIEHGNRTRGTFDVACTFADSELTVEVRDRGAGFAHDAPPQPGRRPTFRGWGIFLMRTLMDAVDYADNGTTVRLRKRLPVAADAASEASGPEG